MNVYLAFCSKKEESLSIPPEVFTPYLLRPPDRIEHWRSRSGRTQLHSFSYWPGLVLTRGYLFQRGQEAVSFDGFPDTGGDLDNAEGYWQSLIDAAGKNMRLVEGEFSVVHAAADRLAVYSNPGGSHAVYCVDTPEFTGFSNRLPLLLLLPGVSRELNPKATQWLCYQGFLQRGETCFAAVRKLMPGDLAVASADKGLTVAPMRFEQLGVRDARNLSGESLARTFEEHCGRRALALKRIHLFHGSLGITLPLSGGKDSRLILALLLRAGLKDSIRKIYTLGPLYSPEVLSAQDMCLKLGLAERHEVRRPPLLNNAIDLDMNMITGTMNLTAGQLSVHDFCGVAPVTEEFIVGGQQNVRDSWYLGCETTSLDTFIKSVFSHHFHDPLGLLRAPGREQFMEEYARAFQDLHRLENVPLDTLAEYFSLRERHGGWTSVILQGAYHGSPVTNPLLHQSLYSFLFGLPASCRHLELYHFMMTAEAAPELLNVPFADQTWPPELQNVLKGTADVPILAPYLFSRHFPSLSNPYLPPRKIAYYNGLKPAMRVLAEKHSDFVGAVLDMDQVFRVLQPANEVLLQELVCGMGLFNMLLLAEHGTALFHRDKSAEVAKSLNETLLERTVDTGTVRSAEEQYMTLIERQEASIGQFVRELQKTASFDSSASKHAVRPWRHIHIKNMLPDSHDFFLSYRKKGRLSEKTAKRAIATGEEFVWGVQFEPGTGVSVICKELGFQQTIELVPTVMKYYVEVTEPSNPTSEPPRRSWWRRSHWRL